MFKESKKDDLDLAYDSFHLDLLQNLPASCAKTDPG